MGTVHALKFPNQPASDSGIVAVASGKGGVGKTWFAITLAHAMSKQGRRTLLFDGDLGLANADIQLGIIPDRDLGATLTGRTPLARCIAPCAATGFDLLAGRSGSATLAALPATRLDALSRDIQNLSGHYERVVLDLGAGIGRPVVSLANRSERCLVLTTDEPTALTDAYAFIKLLRRAHPAADIRIVVNKAATQAQGRKTHESLTKACRNFLGFAPPLAGVIRHDPRVAECIRRQTPVLTRFPNCTAASDVLQIAGSLAT